MFWAKRNGNIAAMDGALTVGSMWFQEATGLNILSEIDKPNPTQVTISIVTAFFGDPFAGSRQAFEALTKQYGSH